MSDPNAPLDSAEFKDAHPFEWSATDILPIEWPPALQDAGGTVSSFRHSQELQYLRYRQEQRIALLVSSVSSNQDFIKDDFESAEPTGVAPFDLLTRRTVDSDQAEALARRRGGGEH